ncbi:MAG: TIGR02757 family protein [Bacteroidota bacterium]|nr:TIGR02757 family protein [Bacteroidota bacterium]
MKEKELQDFLNSKVDLYNQPSFIPDDPICIPHAFTKKQDIEIAGFFAAIFAWGNRTTIIKKSKELMQLMDNSPHEFCLNHSPKDLKDLMHFKHRTFSTTDLLYFIEFFKTHYNKNKSLETAFTPHSQPPEKPGQALSIPSTSSGGEGSNTPNIEDALKHFHHYFFSLEHVPARTKKHIATPERNSSCKRLNMFLRWMVRNDDKGVDFGIWKNISPSQLICPLDLHVVRVAKRLNLLQRKQTDWLAAIELTEFLRTLDKQDPVKYDFALFGMGVMEKF